MQVQSMDLAFLFDQTLPPVQGAEAAEESEDAGDEERRYSLPFPLDDLLADFVPEAGAPLVPFCAECDVNDADYGCVQCHMLLCEDCWGDVHKRYEIRRHVPRAVPPASKRRAKFKALEERKQRTAEARARQVRVRRERARRTQELNSRAGLRHERTRVREELAREEQREREANAAIEKAKQEELEEANREMNPIAADTELGDVPDQWRPRSRLQTGDKSRLWGRAVGTAAESLALPKLEFYDAFRQVSQYADNDRAETAAASTEVLREPDQGPAYIRPLRSPEQERWRYGPVKKEVEEDETMPKEAVLAGWKAVKLAEEKVKRDLQRAQRQKERDKREADERATAEAARKEEEHRLQLADDALESPRHAYMRTAIAGGILPEATMLRAMGESANFAHFGLGPAKVLALTSTMASFSALRELNLAGNRLTNEACVTVLHHSRDIETLTSLDLSDNAFGLEAANALAEVLTTDCTLSRTGLSHTNMRDTTLQALGPALCRNQTLRSLSLANNALGVPSAPLLESVLVANSTLQELELDWNHLGSQGAQLLAPGIAATKALRRLTLGYNSMGDLGCQYVCAALEGHPSLAFIDLSNNGMAAKSCMVLAYALRVNRELKSAVIRENPIGPYGARALTRTMESANVSGVTLCHVDSLGCDLRGTAMHEDDEERIFDPEEPASQYTLQLDDPYQRTIALELLYMYRTKDGFELTNALHRGNPVSLKRGLWHPPPVGELSFDVNHFRRSATHDDVLHSKSMDHMLHRLSGMVRVGKRLVAKKKASASAAAMHLSSLPSLEEQHATELKKIELGDDERLIELAIGVTDLYFDTDKAQVLLDTFLGQEGKLKALVMLVPRLVDHDTVPDFVDRNLSEKQRAEFATEVGFLYNFDPLNATGRYQLELANPLQRLVAIRLLEISNDEAYFGRVVIGREDTSQYNNWMNWRNVVLDDHPMIPSRSWSIPRRGRLQLDYVSTSRPNTTEISVVTATELEDILHEIGLARDSPLRCAAPAEKEARTVLNEHNHSKLVVCLPSCPMFTETDVVLKNTRLGWRVPLSGSSQTYATAIQQLRLLIRERGYYFNAEQVLAIAMCFPAVRDVSDHVFKPRIEALLAVFSRLADLSNIQDVMVMLTDEEEQSVVYRLGWLNLFNPHRPDLFFKLDLSKPDHYTVARMLIKLAVVEPGENWVDETYDGYPFELPLSWVTDPPRYGCLTCTYCSDPEESCSPVWGLREELLRKTLLQEAPPDGAAVGRRSSSTTTAAPQETVVDLNSDSVREGKYQFALKYDLPLPARPESIARLYPS